MRTPAEASTRRGKNPNPCEYLIERFTILADLKAQHLGLPGKWYIQEAHKVRRSRGSGSKTQAKAKKEGTKEKKAQKAKNITNQEKDKEEKAKTAEEDKADKEEKV